jgi:hypothetical protein
MNQEKNLFMKLYLQKLADKAIEFPDLKLIQKVEIFYVFGSPVKSAMCDWVYGMKISTTISSKVREDYVRKLQGYLKLKIKDKFNQSSCPTDVIFE